MKKIGIFVLVAVIALGALGIGYAAWTQSLNIKGTVETANFEVDMNNGTATQPSDSSAHYNQCQPKFRYR